MLEHARFPILEWRRAVASAANRIGTDAIAPFGFELTGSHRYLFSQLRYLFIYIARSAGLPDKDSLVQAVCDALDDTLAEVSSTIEVVDYDRFVVQKRRPAAWRTLIIRSVQAESPILRTWARYIVATALSVNRSRITAVTDFHTDLMAQRYSCQLAIIHEALFSALPNGTGIGERSTAPSLTLREQIGSHLRQLQRISLADRYRFDLVDAAVVDQIGEAIERYYAELNAWIDPVGDPGLNQKVPDFHGGNLLDFPEGSVLDRYEAIAMERYHVYSEPPAGSRAMTP